MENIKDQEIFLLMAIGIIIMLVFATMLVLFYYRSQQALLIQKVTTQQQLVEQTLMTQEEERSRIAKDLHDDIGSKLNVIFLHLQHLKKKDQDKKPIYSTIEFLTEAVDEIISTTRAIAHELIPPTLEEFGFIDAMEELCTAYNKTDNIHILFKHTFNHAPSLSKLEELNLFRILQELISNSIKHGKATQIRIHYIFETNQLQLFYQDNGLGFNSSDLKNKAGLGMKNIESRLRIINGKWVFKPKSQRGFQVHLSLNPNSIVNANNSTNDS